MPVKNNVSIKEVITFLNECLKCDPDAISSLFSIRVACNKNMANHPTLQVAGLSDNYFIFGIMGLLNGIFGSDENGWGHIAADVEGSKILRFSEISIKDIGGPK